MSPTLRLTSLVDQMVKRLSTMRETWVQSLGRKDPLEKEMAPHSSTLAWRIPWTEEPGRLQSMGWQRVGHDWATSLHFTEIWTQINWLLKLVGWPWVVLFLVYLVPHPFPAMGFPSCILVAAFRKAWCDRVIRSYLDLFLLSASSWHLPFLFRLLLSENLSTYMVSFVCNGWRATQARLPCLCSLGLCREMLGHTWEEAHSATLLLQSIGPESIA